MARHAQGWILSDKAAVDKLAGTWWKASIWQETRIPWPLFSRLNRGMGQSVKESSSVLPTWKAIGPVRTAADWHWQCSIWSLTCPHMSVAVVHLWERVCIALRPGSCRAWPLRAAGEDVIAHNAVPNEKAMQGDRAQLQLQVIARKQLGSRDFSLCYWLSFLSHRHFCLSTSSLMVWGTSLGSYSEVHCCLIFNCPWWLQH